ncbi:MAG TPA: pitrilysin family protein [Pyrinomonadaceae bacterium]|nr:pitrilysin family protein [Pyrinomonadaceae bacterium]
MRRYSILFALILALSPFARTAAQAENVTPAAQLRRVTAYSRQGAAATRPAPAAQAFQPAQLVSRVLKNGLEVIVLEDRSIPLVTLELAVKNGSYTEPPELNGLSHLYEHMFFKANREALNPKSYIHDIDKIGLLMNASTREEIVNYYFHTTSPHLRAAMNFMRDSARYPLFDERQFEQERQAVLGEIDRHESNPGFYLQQEMTNRLFYKHPSRKNPGGNRKTVSEATTATMRLIQQRYYVPNNSALVVTGDARPEEVFRLAEEFFGDWPRREKDPFAEFPLVEHPPLPRSSGTVIEQPVNNIILAIGWHGPSIGKDDAATYAADVFSFILRQPDSRFQRALVDTGLVTGVDLSYYTQRNVGPIQIFAQTTPDKAKAALRAIYKEIDGFDDPDYYTDAQLEAAKSLLEADDLYGREKPSEYAHTIGFWWSSTGLEYFRGYLGQLRRTSRADINRYVKTYIQGKPRVGIALLSAETQRQAQLTEKDLTGE